MYGQIKKIEQSLQTSIFVVKDLIKLMSLANNGTLKLCDPHVKRILTVWFGSGFEIGS